MTKCKKPNSVINKFKIAERSRVDENRRVEELRAKLEEAVATRQEAEARLETVLAELKKQDVYF